MLVIIKQWNATFEILQLTEEAVRVKLENLTTGNTFPLKF